MLRLASLLVLLSLGGCGSVGRGDDDRPGPVDSGTDDPGPAVDAGASDAGPGDDGGVPDAGSPRDLRVVFVGNSYTFFHELPAMVEAMLEDLGVPVDVDAVTAGGRTLRRHALDLGDPETALGQALAPAVTHVVLQEQSQIPGFPREGVDWIASRDAILELGAAVDRVDAAAVLYQTWGRRDGDAANPDLYPDYSTMQDRLTAGYAAYEEALGSVVPADVAPVGEAFRQVHDGDGGFRALYAGDGSHPSLEGSYLAALVLAGTLSGDDPEDVTFHPVDLDPERAGALRVVAARILGR